MKACDFVRAILQDLNAANTVADTPGTANKRGYFLVEIEKKMTFRKLNDFLNLYASSQQEVDIGMLEEFKEFLRARWLFIKDTDAIYSHSPYTLANRSYSILARHVGEALNELPLNLLMPGKYRFKKMPSSNAYTMRPQDFTFGDNGQPLIIILALDNLRRDMQETGDLSLHKTSALTQDEIARFAFHSNASKHYYAAIVSRADKNKLDEARDNLKKELVTNNYPVTSTYSTQGEERLLNRLLSTITSQDELIAFLTDIVPRQYWNVFLGRINHQVFFSIMFGLECAPDKLSEKVLENIEAKLLAELNKPELADIGKERALVFCLLEVYQCHGKASPEYGSILGAFVGRSMPSLTGTFPKSLKLEACLALKAFLVNKKPIDSKHAGPLSSGNLGLLRERTDNLQKSSFLEMHALPTFKNS